MKTHETMNAVGLVSMTEIERRYDPARGRHWFDKASLKFFQSHLPQYGYEGPGGVFFVSSEQFESNPRTFSVRQLKDVPARSEAHRATHSIVTIDRMVDCKAAQAKAKRMASGMESWASPPGPCKRW